MKKLFVAYRNNNLFQNYVPAILGHLPREVVIEKVVYPAGTDRSEIIADLPSRLPTNEKFLCLFDRTCEHAAYKVERDYRAELVILHHSIDELFNNVAKKLFDTRTEEGIRLGIVKLVGLLCDESPSAVEIISRSLTDHMYHKSFEKYQAGGDGEDARGITANERGMAEFLSNVFKEMFPSVSVDVQPYPSSHYGEGTVVVADRHSLSSDICWDIDGWSHGAKLLLLTFENAIAHLTTMGRLAEQFDTKSQCGELEKWLEKQAT